MSILLDSLKKTDESTNKRVPNVYDSHFDDEMLNDDELIRSNRLWKSVSLFLMLVLISSWIYFIYFDSNYSNQIPVLDTNQSQSNAAISHLKSEIDNPQKTEPVIKNNKVLKQPLEIAENKQEAAVKPYQPKKRSTNIDKNILVKKQPQVIEPVKGVSGLQELDSSNEGSILYYEDLTTELLSELPNLEINSYAVSDNIKKSFVVMNGSFYGINEIVSPNLKIVTIDKSGVVFKYKELLIRKRHQ